MDSYRSADFSTWHTRALDPHGGSYPHHCKSSYVTASGSSRPAQKLLQMAGDQWCHCAWALCWCQWDAGPIRFPAHLQIWNSHFRCSDTGFRPSMTSSYFSWASCGRTGTLWGRPFRNPASCFLGNGSRGKKGSTFLCICYSKTWWPKPSRNLLHQFALIGHISEPI